MCCSTRFPPDIAATLLGLQAFPALLVSLDPEESPDNLEDLDSLELQDYLEIKEKEVLFRSHGNILTVCNNFNVEQQKEP